MLEDIAKNFPTILLAATGLQGTLYWVDELVCHRRRKLGRWESLGHPVDSLFLSLPLWISGYIGYSSQALWWYAGLSVWSCLVVTKDEWVHAQECDGFEMWLHAMMFCMHPIVLSLVAVSWWLDAAQWVRSGLPFLVTTIGIYQLIYWNFTYARTNQ